MSEHEERHDVTSLTPRVTDLARTSIEVLLTRTLWHALRASIELGKLGFTMRALSDMHRVRAWRSGVCGRPPDAAGASTKVRVVRHA